MDLSITFFHWHQIYCGDFMHFFFVLKSFMELPQHDYMRVIWAISNNFYDHSIYSAWEWNGTLRYWLHLYSLTGIIVELQRKIHNWSINNEIGNLIIKNWVWFLRKLHQPGLKVNNFEKSHSQCCFFDEKHWQGNNWILTNCLTYSSHTCRQQLAAV